MVNCEVEELLTWDLLRHASCEDVRDVRDDGVYLVLVQLHGWPQHVQGRLEEVVEEQHVAAVADVQQLQAPRIALVNLLDEGCHEFLERTLVAVDVPWLGVGGVV